MAEAFTDPGFESVGLPDWTLVGEAAQAGTPVRTGAYSLRLRTSYTGLGVKTVSRAIQTVPSIPFQEYPLAVWVNADGVPNDDSRLRVYVDGSVHDVVFKSGLGAGWALWTAANFTATGSQTEIEFRVDHPGGGAGQDDFFLDDASITEPGTVAITRALRDALVADLQDIDGTGIFSTTVDTVYAEPTEMSRRSHPSATLMPIQGGIAEGTTLACRLGSATQRFTVEFAVRSSTPVNDVMDFLDDVRNAVERTTSNVKTALSAISGASVLNFEVTEWEPALTGEDVSHETGLYRAEVVITYEYERGAA